MSKYSLDFKLSAISMVINQSRSILSVSRELNVRKSKTQRKGTSKYCC
jgi:transposase-like protein